MITETVIPAPPKEMIDSEKLRADFPILHQKVHGHPLIYFDNAAASQKPRAVLDALRHYYERVNANVPGGIRELDNGTTAVYEAARDRAGRVIDARRGAESVFGRGAPES